MTFSSWSICRYALRARRRGPYRSAAPSATRCRSQVDSVCPSGTSQSGRSGATSFRSKTQDRASSAVRSTTPGKRAIRAAISPAERMCAVPVAGSQDTMSSSPRRARTAASASASGASFGAA